MASKRPVAPDTPVRSFPTPNINDLVVVLDVDSRLPGYKPLEYGALHPDQTRFTGAKLVYQEPLDGSDQFVRRIYATDRAGQDAYNYAIKYSAGSPGHPIYLRTYVTARADYSPLSDGSPDPAFKDAFLVEEEMAPVEGELNSLYVRVTRVFETLPGPVLTSFETNDAGQKVTVTTQRKSSKDYTLPAASATSSPSAAAEDTGVVTEQIRSVPAVFARQQFSAERPDPLPSKFRAAVPDVETSALVAGTAQQPTLTVPQDLSASETQETQFLKRVSRRLRPDPDYPVTFTETTRTNAGQLATVTSVLDLGVQTAETGPLIESSEVTDLGDGRSIKVTAKVQQVFEQPAFTRLKEDLTPPKFRAAVTEQVEERTTDGVAAMPESLMASEIEKSEQQLTVFTKRVRTRERDVTTTATLSGQTFTTELGGGTAEVIEQYGTNPTITPGFGTIAAEKENLGDNKFVTRSVVLKNPPKLFGQRYDESFDVVVPFSEVVIDPKLSDLGTNGQDIQPKDLHHSILREIDVEEIRKTLLDEQWSVAAYVNIDLPDILEEVTAIRTGAKTTGGATGTGDNWSVRASGSSNESVDLRWKIRNGYTGLVPATRYVFFLDKDNTSFDVIAARVNAEALPALFPESITMTTVGGSVSQERAKARSFNPTTRQASTADGTSFGATLNSTVVIIPPTLHSALPVTEIKVTLGTYTGTGSTITAGNLEFSGDFVPKQITATKPASFPPGNYIVAVESESYKYSLVRITAVVAHVTAEYTT